MGKQDNQNAEIVPIKPPESKEKAQERQTQFWRKMGLWALLVLFGMIIGAGVLFFTLYLPKDAAYKTLTQQYDQLYQNNEVNKAASEEKGEALFACSQDLEESAAAAQKAELLKNAYAVLFGAKEAQEALGRIDTASARTALNVAKGYMDELVLLVDEQDSVEGLSGPLNEAISQLSSSPQKSLTQLEVLINNLNYYLRGIEDNQ